jgi:predicted nucleotidyltransferase
MRLTPDQAEAIRSSIRLHLGEQSRIWLFGSRVDDQRRGGDVDLYVEPESQPTLMDRLRCKVALADALDLNVDLVVQQPGRDLPIYRIARRHGLRL